MIRICNKQIGRILLGPHFAWAPSYPPAAKRSSSGLCARSFRDSGQLVPTATLRSPLPAGDVTPPSQQILQHHPPPPIPVPLVHLAAQSQRSLAPIPPVTRWEWHQPVARWEWHQPVARWEWLQGEASCQVGMALS